jgi:hypothetical protein
MDLLQSLVTPTYGASTNQHYVGSNNHRTSRSCASGREASVSISNERVRSVYLALSFTSDNHLTLPQHLGGIRINNRFSVKRENCTKISELRGDVKQVLIPDIDFLIRHKIL